ncbi:t-SNARE [Tricharina praecox]|uniref:t-SNARE n=1 Tax=Tricharina praecox TaxID=43433 RepID=UPI00221F2588|nr:t-SNARE [Tricharina praecox]KAI5845555.1 t-SNARE [Tricharina praecox]
MSNPYGSSIPLLPSQRAHVGPLELPNFLSEISAFNTQLSTFASSVEQVGQLHNAALQSTADSDSTGYSGNASSRLEAAVAECSAQARALKDFLKSLERDMLLTERDGDYDQGRTKHGQVDKARANLQAGLREFEKTERMYRTRYNELLARQYRIVHPDASEEEIGQAVESGQTQVFSQALLSSNRSASANSVAKAVRERQQDIARIERTLEELMVLFEQMNEQVLLADPVVANIEHQSENVTTDVEQAQKHLGTAVVSAKGARRKKWICLFIAIGIVALIGVVDGVGGTVWS